MEIGFRLSYLAVIGIVYFYPKIYALLTVKNKWADKVWSISAVSIAAQLTTFPISIYYFHQFPLLFLLPNLIVIPLSNFILFLGTGLFVCAWVPYLNSALGWLLAHLLTLLNGGIFLVEKIPYNLIEGISLNVLEMLLLYTLFLTGAWFIESKRPKALLASLVVLLFFSTAAFYRFASAQGQSLFTVYHVKNESALTFLQNGVATYRFSDTLYTNRSAMLYHIKPHWWDNGIRQEKAVTATSDSLPFGELLYQNGKKILVVNQEVSKVNAAFARRLQVDYVVLSKNAKVYLSNLAKMVDFSTVIFDSGVKRYYVPYWIKDCKSLHLNYWDVNTQGAFTAKL